MTDQNRMTTIKDAVVRVETKRLPHLGLREPFSRSNGTIIARLYERLTKASRRRVEHATHVDVEIGQSREQTIESAYRQGVYDAFKALQQELS